MAVAGVLSASKVISSVVQKALSLYDHLQTAKRNTESFKELGDHVKDVAEVLKTLEEQGVDESVVKTGLEIFERAMKSADKLLQDYGRSNKLMYFLRAKGWKDRFANVDDQLVKAKQHLTLAIQVEQRGQNQVNKTKRKVIGESRMLILFLQQSYKCKSSNNTSTSNNTSKTGTYCILLFIKNDFYL